MADCVPAAHERGMRGLQGEPEGETVRIVWVRAAPPGPLWDACFRRLSAAEQLRANAMRAGTARDEFVTGRALLRSLLGVAAAAVELRSGPHGKPEIAGTCFSVAHARGLVGIALGGSRELGLDVEWTDRAVEVQDIAAAHFTPAEQALLREADDPVHAFFVLWTRKEAAVKAVGLGLGTTLEGLDVSRGDRAEVAGQTVHLQLLGMSGVTGEAGWVGCLGSVGGPVSVEMEWLRPEALLDLLLQAERDA